MAAPLTDRGGRAELDRAAAPVTVASQRWAIIRLAAVSVLSAASLWLLPLSVLAIVLVLIVALSLPQLPPRLNRGAWTAIVVSALLSLGGLTRFAVEKAMAGIAEGGQRAAGASALWRLREVMLAQDGMRKQAYWDPDRDGVGSAALIATLAGKQPLRGQRPLAQPLLNYRFRELVETRIGPAIRVAGHLIIVCLPKAGGGWTAQPGDPIDDELAERRFLAYAWPGDVGVDVQSTYFIDEHDRILVLEKPVELFRGSASPPSCEAGIGGDPRARWESWRHKQPRFRLPGDDKP